MSENAKEMFPKILITLFRFVGFPDFQGNEDQQSISQLKVAVPSYIINAMSDGADANELIADWVHEVYPQWMVAQEQPELMNNEQYQEWRMEV